ncbi:hypothetical protein COBT_002181 [Conglomerata obtusa]
MEKNLAHDILSSNEIMQDSLIIEYIDECVFLSLIFLYTFWRMFKSENFSLIKLFKGNMRTIGIFFLMFSSIATIIYSGTIVYLSNFYEIDKSYLEKVGHLEGIHLFTLYNRKIDLIQVLNIALSYSHILKMSALFILIGLWLPCAYTFAISNKEMNNQMQTENDLNLLFFSGKESLTSQKNLAEALSHATIITFSTLYAFLRIPLSGIFDLNYNYMPEKTMIFYRSVFYGSEIYVCVLFFLILETRFLGILQKTTSRNRAEKKPVEHVNFLIILLVLDAFMRYYINIINIPIDLNKLTLHVMKKITFITQVTITLLLTSMFCPLSEQIYEKRNESLATEKPFWRPSDRPRFNYDDEKRGEIVVSEIDNPNQECSNTAIIEFNDYRESVVQGK